MGHGTVQRLFLWVPVKYVVQGLGELDELSLVNPGEVLYGLLFLKDFILPLFQVGLQVHFSSTSFWAFPYHSIFWKFKRWWQMQLEEEFELICEGVAVQSIEGTAELLKVDKAVLVLVYQAEDPEGEGALGGAESPRLQQEEEDAELLKTQLILLQVRQAGVVMEQRGTINRPVAAEEMLPFE